MNRPFVAWAAVAALSGALLGLGCSKPKKETPPDSAPPPITSTAGGGPPRGTPGNPGTPSAPNTPPSRNTPNTPVAPNTPVTPTTPATPGEITVSACRFDAVEAAIAGNKGKVVLVDCWATWCPPCRSSFPKLVEKHQKYADKGLAVISLSLDPPNKSSEVLAFLRENKATFTNLYLTMDGAAQRGLQERFAYGNAIPHAVLFDKTGQRAWSGHPMDPACEQRLVAELGK